MDDIVERLKSLEAHLDDWREVDDVDQETVKQARAEIARLRAKVASLTRTIGHMGVAVERMERAEAKVAKADALAEAHGKLWSALAEIIEAPGVSPNATVRRMAARAEKALVEDAIGDVKPVPRFYRETDT
jgi:uncharacterized membrane-anchored protein YjiN (DUF445 family)